MIKKILKTVFWTLIGILVISVVTMALYISNLNNRLGIYDNNLKAINLENSANKEQCIAYRFEVDQLNYINDSIVSELNEARNKLKIKDYELKQLQKIKTETHIIDSVLIRDTVFRKEFVKLDTSIVNNWYSTNITLEYPNKLLLDMKYTSDINVIASTQKEIIGTPKKCFIGRWFQKKHNVIRVDVKDNNPYSVIKESKFIIIE